MTMELADTPVLLVRGRLVVLTAARTYAIRAGWYPGASRVRVVPVGVKSIVDLKYLGRDGEVVHCVEGMDRLRVADLSWREGWS